MIPDCLRRFRVNRALSSGRVRSTWLPMPCTTRSAHGDGGFSSEERAGEEGVGSGALNRFAVEGRRAPFRGNLLSPLRGCYGAGACEPAARRRGLESFAAPRLWAHPVLASEGLRMVGKRVDGEVFRGWHRQKCLCHIDKSVCATGTRVSALVCATGMTLSGLVTMRWIRRATGSSRSFVRGYNQARRTS